MKHLRKLFIVLLAALSVTAGLIGLAACGGGEETGGNAIGDEYKSIYQFYKEAAGDDAASLEDWYADLSADIEALDAGEMSEISVVDVNSVTNVKVTFENGKIYLQPLMGGGDFHEYALFVLNAKNAEGTAVARVSLNICALNEGEYEVLQTVQTNVRGTADAYCEVTSAGLSYYVQVAEASAATYGIPHGYEPELSASEGGRSTVDVTIGTPIQYAISVHDNGTSPVSDYSGMEVSLRYTETAKQGFVVTKGTTAADGSLTLTFTPHEGSTYELVVKEGTQPDGYEDVEPASVDLEGKATTLELYVAKKYAQPQQITFTAPDDKMADVTNRSVELVELGEALGALVKGDDNFYTYDGESVYVALGYQLDRVYNGKTIAQLLEDPATQDYFSYEVRTDDATNTWTKYLFHDMLAAYIAKADNNGLYPLNEDLYNFIQKAKEYHLFAGAEETDDDLEILLPLVKYGEPWLAVGGPEVDVTSKEENLHLDTSDVYGSVIEIPVDGITKGGYYQFSVKDVTFAETSASVTIAHYTYYGFTLDDYIIKNSEQFPNQNYRHYFILSQVDRGNLFQGNVYLPEGCKSITLVIKWIVNNGSYQTPLNGATLKAELKEIEGGEDWTSVEPVLFRVDDSVEASAEKEFEVLAFPKSWISTTSAQNTWETNWATYGSLIATDRGYETYTFSVTEEGIAGTTNLKMYYAQIYLGDVRYVSGRFYNMISSSSSTTLAPETPMTLTVGGDYTLNVTNRYAYVPVFVHDGGAPVKIKVTFKTEWSAYRVHYSAGDGTGDDAIADGFYNASVHYALDPAALGYTWEGHTFTGWKFVDAEEQEHIVLPGEAVSFRSSDENHFSSNVFFVAQWRENAANPEDKTLGLGDSGKTSVTLDGSKYTETEVKLASGVTEGYYKLTADLGTGTLNSFTVTADGVPSLLTADAAATGDSNHIYITYFKVGADTKSIHFPTPNSDFGSATASLKLEKIDESGLTISDSKTASAQVPVNRWQPEPGEDEAAPELFKAKLADGVVAGSYYISVARLEGYTIKVCTESATLDLGTNTEGYIDIAEGDEHIWLVGTSERFAQNILATVSLHRVYTITFEKGEGGNTVTGTVKTQYCEGGETVQIQSSTYTRSSYTFRGWIYDDGETETVYKSGADFEMPMKDVVFTAKWLRNAKASVSASTSVNSVVIDPEQYTSLEITASSVAFYFDNGQKNSFMFIFELGNTEFNAPGFSFSGGMNFFYSDALSTPTNKVYVAFYVPSSQYMNTRTFTMSNLDIFDGYRITAKLSYIKTVHSDDNLSRYDIVGAADERVAPAGGSGAAFALQPANSTGKTSGFFRNAVNSNLIVGGKFVLHIKTNGFKVQGLAEKDGDLTFTPKEDSNGYEWTADLTVISLSMSATNGYLLTYTSLRIDGTDTDIAMNTSTPVYIADAWLEAKPQENVLSETTPLTVKVSKAAEGTIALGSSILKNTDYILKATFKDTKADVTVAAKTSVTLTEADGYRNKHVQFSAGTVTVTTESEQELEVTFSIKRFAPSTISDVQDEQDLNRYELPEGKQDIDLVPSSTMKTDASTTGFKVWLNLSDVDAAAKDNVVIKLSTGDEVWEFNKSNNWTQEYVTFTGNYYAIWSENGRVVVSVRVEKLISIKPGSSSSSRSVTVSEEEGKDEIDFWFYGDTVKNDGNHRYYFRIRLGSSTDDFASLFSLTYDGNKTAAFAKDSSNSNYYSAYFEPTAAARKITLNYSGEGEKTISDNGLYSTSDVTMYSGSDRSMTLTKARTQYYVTAPATNKPYYVKFTASVPLGEEEGVDTTKDFSGLTINFPDDGKSGQPLTVTGFTKETDGVYVAYAIVNFQKDSYVRFTYSGIDSIDTWQLSFNTSYDVKTLNLSGWIPNESFGTGKSTSYPVTRYYFPHEGAEAEKEYTLRLTTPNAGGGSGHEADKIVFKVTQGVEGAPIELNAENNYTAKIKFTSTDALVAIEMSGCTSTTTSANHYTSVCLYDESEAAEKEVTVDGEATNGKIVFDNVESHFKLTGDALAFPGIYRITVKETSSGNIPNSKTYYLKNGEQTYKFIHGEYTDLVYLTSADFTIYRDGYNATDITVEAASVKEHLKVNDESGFSYEANLESTDHTWKQNGLIALDLGTTLEGKTYDITIKDTTEGREQLPGTWGITASSNGTELFHISMSGTDGSGGVYVYRDITLSSYILKLKGNFRVGDPHNITVIIEDHAAPTEVKVDQGTDVAVQAGVTAANKLAITPEDSLAPDQAYDFVIKLKDSPLAEGETAKLTLGSFGTVTAAYGDAAETEYIIYGAKFTDDNKIVLLSTTANKQLTWTISLRQHTDVTWTKDTENSVTVPKGVTADQKFTVTLGEALVNGNSYDITVKLKTELGGGSATLTVGSLFTVTAATVDHEYTFSNVYISDTNRVPIIVTNATKELTWSVKFVDHVNPKIKVGESTDVAVKASLTAAAKYCIEVDSSVDLSKEYDIVVKLKNKATVLTSGTAGLLFGNPVIGSVTARYNDNLEAYYIWGMKFTEETKKIVLATSATKDLTWEISLQEHKALAAIKPGETYTVTVPARPDSGNNFRIPLSEEFNADTLYSYSVQMVNWKSGTRTYIMMASGTKTGDYLSATLQFTTSNTVSSSAGKKYADYLYLYAYSSESYVNKEPAVLKITITAKS